MAILSATNDLVDDMQDPKETKSETFKRIANSRVGLTVERMRTLHKLNASRYDYTKTDVEFIVALLRKEVDDVEHALLGTTETSIPQL